MKEKKEGVQEKFKGRKAVIGYKVKRLNSTRSQRNHEQITS